MARTRGRQLGPEARIEDILIGPSRVQALYVAARLGVFDLLAHGPLTSTVLASTSGVHPGALHRLMRFLAAEGFCEPTDDGRFALAPSAEPLLRGAMGGMREALLSTATRGWAVWEHLLESVETGRPAFDRVFGKSYFAEQRENPASLAAFDAGLASGAAEAGRALARAVQPAACVADIGCGSGALLIELLRCWPAARGVAFDRPEVLAAAGPRFDSAALAGRLERREGDFFDAVPGGAQLYVLSLVLHDWDDEQALRLLRNCQAAMPPGARLAVVEQIAPEDPRQAPRSAHADLGMLVMTGGRERTLAEYRSLLERAGLRFDGTRELGTSRQSTLIEASRGLM